MIGVEGVDSENVVFSVFPAVVSVELDAVNICDVVRGVWLTLEDDDVLITPEGDEQMLYNDIGDKD